MTYFNDTLNTTWSERLLTSLGQWLEDAALRGAQRRVYHTTLNELNALTTRELADLGISRSEVRRIALEAGQMVTRA